MNIVTDTMNMAIITILNIVTSIITTKATMDTNADAADIQPTEWA